MTCAIVLQHVPFEGPGRIRSVAERLGLSVEVREVFAGHRVPEELAADEVLIVMGGPMGVGDLGDPRYPFLAHEVELLHRVIADDRPMLGICLGAQLLAHAAGARVFPNTRPAVAGVPAQRVLEVGWAPVDFSIGHDPIVAGLEAREIMLHWHGDTFDLPPGATHLASTPLCRRQAFRLRRQVGIQFHCEVESETIADWVREDAAFVELANGAGGGERILADTTRYLPRHREVGDRLIANALTQIAG